MRYESVMALRTKLDELGKMEGIAYAEKGNPLTDTSDCTCALSDSYA